MSIETLVVQILDKMPTIGSWSNKFWKHFLIVMLVCRGKHNFTNLARYSNLSETTIRNRFAKGFDFLSFNGHLHDTLESEERIIAFDPCYLPKSGRHTEGASKFWSGCAGAVKKGLEICGFASVGLESKTAMHLIARQTIIVEENQSLIDFYISLLKEYREEFLKISNLFVADAYFSNFKYVDAVVSSKFHFIGKLASNNILRYQYKGDKTGKPGRPKQFDGRVDKLYPDPNHFSIFYENPEDGVVIYEGVVNVKMLKRNAKCVIVHEKQKSGKIKIYSFFTTDISMIGTKVIKCYKLRFQIEFLFRDAKQFVGLSECQARSKEKLHTHINTSLTTVSLAKAVHYLSLPTQERTTFSMSSVKVSYFNENYIDMIFRWLQRSPKLDKNSPEYKQLKSYGCIAA